MTLLSLAVKLTCSPFKSIFDFQQTDGARDPRRRRQPEQACQQQDPRRAQQEI